MGIYSVEEDIIQGLYFRFKFQYICLNIYLIFYLREVDKMSIRMIEDKFCVMGQVCSGFKKCWLQVVYIQLYYCL